MRPRIPALIAAVTACATAVMTGLAPGVSASPTVPAQAHAQVRTAPPPPEGGRAIYAGSGVRCALGFNVRKSDTYYFLTAGGCAKVGLRIYADPALTVELGTVVAVTTASIALVRYVNPQVERPGSVHTYPGTQDIATAGRPTAGQRVCRSGPQAGLRCGSVTAVNLTINLPNGTINGVARANICSEPPELSGAPYFAGTMAVGIEIGASGGCAGGGSSYFLPIGEILNAFGVTVY